MAVRYVEIVNGTSDPRYPAHRDGALAASLFVDSSNGYQLTYSANGVDTVVSPRISALVIASAATLAVTPALHAGRVVGLSRISGVTVTLPAATGSGAIYCFAVVLALTSLSHVIKVANAQDYMRGASYTATDNGSGAGFTWPTANTGTVATESDTFTMNGTTQGGIVGNYVEVQDIAANVWSIEALMDSTGTEATPFSVGV